MLVQVGTAPATPASSSASGPAAGSELESLMALVPGLPHLGDPDPHVAVAIDGRPCAQNEKSRAKLTAPFRGAISSFRMGLTLWVAPARQRDRTAAIVGPDLASGDVEACRQPRCARAGSGAHPLVTTGFGLGSSDSRDRRRGLGDERGTEQTRRNDGESAIRDQRDRGILASQWRGRV